jgi:hypothetical protein
MNGRILIEPILSRLWSYKSRISDAIDFAVERSHSSPRPEPPKALAGGAGGDYSRATAAARED